MPKEIHTSTKPSENLIWYAIFFAICFCIFLASSVHAQPQAQPKGKAFATPKEAADALIKAAADYNVTALREILGTDAEDLVASEDPVQDLFTADHSIEIPFAFHPNNWNGKQKIVTSDGEGGQGLELRVNRHFFFLFRFGRKCRGSILVLNRVFGGHQVFSVPA